MTCGRRTSRFWPRCPATPRASSRRRDPVESPCLLRGCPSIHALPISTWRNHPEGCRQTHERGAAHRARLCGYHPDDVIWKGGGMKPFRWLAAGLIWVLASLLGLVGALLCVTVVLLPVGLLLLSLSRRLYR